MSIRVIKPGLLTTVQDLGRYGYQKHGVIVNGAMDPFALRMANLLVRNDANQAVLEITLMGPSLQFEVDACLAICGANLSPMVDGEPIPGWRPVHVKKDSILHFGAPLSGCRAYLAVTGGFDIPGIMGSKSTYLRAEIGGWEGRALKKGDVLPLNAEGSFFATGDGAGFASTRWAISSDLLPKYEADPVVRVIRGNQFDLFDDQSKESFFASEFLVTPQSDRMGYRLAGPTLGLRQPMELISEAVAAGTIQVPPEGNPIVLLADRQTTGGYPKIAQIASVDLPVIAQVSPGGKVRFQEISLQEAEELYLLREMDIQILTRGIALQQKREGNYV